MEATPTKAERGPWFWIAAGGAVAMIALVIGIGLAVGGERARPRVDYPQDTPERVLESAYQMLADERADHLPDLLYAESPEVRGVFNRLGRLLGNLQELATVIQQRFPEDVAAVREDAQQSGGAISLGFGPGGEGLPSAGVRRILADPFGWIERNRDRVTVLQTADDRAAVMVDGKPAFGVGLAMIERGDRWFISPPLNLPFVQRFLPQSRDEWAIVASMLEVFENVAVELRAEVAGGAHRDLEAVAQRAGEKAAAPIVMCVMAYNRAMEARGRAQ